MSNNPRWLTKEEFDEITNYPERAQCLDIIAGVFSLNDKWYFVGRDFEGVNEPYDDYMSAVKSCVDYLENDPHWLSEEEMSLLPDDQKVLSDSTTQLNGKWYFYNETYSQLCGPYQTREDAQKAQEEYEDTL